MAARHSLMFAAWLCGALAPCAAAPASPAQAQAGTPLAFIHGFYRDYFADPAAARKRHVDSGAFYSRAVYALLRADAAACAAMSRDIQCGYGAGGDEFFQAQETDPDFSLASSGFKAWTSGGRLVDVTFRLFRDDPSSQRTIRYVLVREDGQWRVDNVIYKENGRFSPKHGMRRRLAGTGAY